MGGFCLVVELQRWRICYQWGLPRLVLKSSLVPSLLSFIVHFYPFFKFLSFKKKTFLSVSVCFFQILSVYVPFFPFLSVYVSISPFLCHLCAVFVHFCPFVPVSVSLCPFSVCLCQFLLETYP